MILSNFTNMFFVYHCCVPLPRQIRKHRKRVWKKKKMCEKKSSLKSERMKADLFQDANTFLRDIQTGAEFIQLNHSKEEILKSSFVRSAF